MALFGRKTVIACVAVAFAALLMLGTTSTIYFHNPLPCDEEHNFESLSPDEQWTAEVMERRCEDSPLIIHVYLHRLEEPVYLGGYSGLAAINDVFVMEHHDGDPELSLEWDSLSQLTIRCPTCQAQRVKMHKDHWGPITVRYQLAYPDNR